MDGSCPESSAASGEASQPAVNPRHLKQISGHWPQSRMEDEKEDWPGMISVEREPRQLIVAAALMVATALIQTIGVVVLEDLVWLWRSRVAEKTTLPRTLAVLSGVVLYLFALHLAQMSVWAALYLQVTTYPSLTVALYESALAFTTMNVPQLPPTWRFLGPAEGIAGMLMFAWSTGVMLTQMSWVGEARRKYLRGRQRTSRSDS